MENTIEKKEPAYGSFEYWYDYLHTYMENYHFHIDDEVEENIKSIAESATDIYWKEVNSGNAMGAGELANQRLFSSIGDSEYEVIERILTDECQGFNESIDVSDTRWLEFWVDTLSQIPGIFDNCRIEWGYGLNPEWVEDNYGKICNKIRKYLTDNGFLQPTEDAE